MSAARGATGAGATGLTPWATGSRWRTRAAVHTSSPPPNRANTIPAKIAGPLSMAPRAPFLPPARAPSMETGTRGRRPDEPRVNAAPTRPRTSPDRLPRPTAGSPLRPSGSRSVLTLIPLLLRGGATGFGAETDRIQTAPGGGIFPVDFLLSVRLTVHTILLNPFFQSSSSATQPYTRRSWSAAQVDSNLLPDNLVALSVPFL